MHPSLLIVAIVVVALAGCGGQGHKATPQPKLPRDLAEQLATQSDEVARKLDAGDSCGAQQTATDLQRRTIAAINAGRVPAPLQEPLQGAVTALVSKIQCSPAPATPGNGHGKGKPKKHKGGAEGD